MRRARDQSPRPGRRGAALAPFLLAALVLGSCRAAPPAPSLELPSRAPDAVAAADLVETLDSLDIEAREARIHREVAGGNVPGWLRELGRVELRGSVDGVDRRVTFWVTPDYLSVGSDDDFFFIPLSPGAAARLADALGATLPTPAMVDAIWASARARLSPIRLPPDGAMTEMPYFENHNRLILAQRWLRKLEPGTFVAGHKKDLVITPSEREGRLAVALYGWHRRDGEPIQPLYTQLADDWVVYNHGVRLVHREVLVDGQRRDLLEVLGDPTVRPLLMRGGAGG